MQMVQLFYCWFEMKLLRYHILLYFVGFTILLICAILFLSEDLVRISHKISREMGQDVASDSFSNAREHGRVDKASAFENEDGVKDCPNFQRVCKKSELGYLLKRSQITWPVSSPAIHGIDPIKLRLLQKNLEAKRTNAFLIVKNGEIITEWYNLKRGWSPTRKHHTASLAKALVGGMTLLIACQDGNIHLEDPAWKYISSWKEDAMKSKITISHLATHSSGIENPQGEIGKSQKSLPGWKGVYWRDVKQRFAMAIDEAPVQFPPGTQMEYSNTGMSALAYSLAISLQMGLQSDIRTLLRERIMEPLEIPESDWSISYNHSHDMNGLKLYEIGGGAAYTARAAARVAQLLIQKGKWKGRQLINSKMIDTLLSYDESPTPYDTKVHPRASLGWWSNIDGAFEKLPRDAIIGAGRGHQIVLVIPSLDLIAVRFGKSLSKVSEYGLSGNYWVDLEQLFLNPLMDANLKQK